MRSDTDSVEQHSISDSGNKGSPGYRLRLLSNSLKHPSVPPRFQNLITSHRHHRTPCSEPPFSLHWTIHSQPHSLLAAVLSSVQSSQHSKAITSKHKVNRTCHSFILNSVASYLTQNKNLSSQMSCKAHKAVC